MNEKNILKKQLIFQSSLITGIAVLAGILGVTGITSFPAGFGAMVIVFIAPFYFLAASIISLVSIKSDKEYLSKLTEEEKNNLLEDKVAKFQTISQQSTYGATFALTLIIPASLVLLSLMIFRPGVNAVDTDKYTIPMMIIGTMLVITSVWLAFANHLNIFSKKQRITQKLAIKEKAAEWKIVKMSIVWTTVVWVIGGILSIAAMISAIFDGVF